METFTVNTVSTVFTGDGYAIFTSYAVFTRNANGVQAVKIFIKTDYNFTILVIVLMLEPL